MALEIRSTPVLTGEDAERFVREADENERNPQRRKLLFSFEDIDRWVFPRCFGIEGFYCFRICN